jgi:hypothetical protein
MSKSTNTPATDDLRPFKPFQYIDPAQLDGKRIPAGPVAHLLNHTLDVVHGVQSIVSLLEAHGIDRACDAPRYLNGYTAGTLERLAIRALNQLGHEAQVMSERIQGDTPTLRPVLDALETLECRVLSSSADVSALSHLARRAKFDLLNLARRAMRLKSENLELLRRAWLCVLPPVTKLVLQAYCLHASKQLVCWQSLARTAALTGLNQRTVQRHIRTLQADRAGDSGRTRGRAYGGKALSAGDAAHRGHRAA